MSERYLCDSIENEISCAVRGISKPIGKRVLIKLRKPEQVYKGGIAIAETAPALPIDGYVAAIGDDAKPYCKVGDRVCFHKNSGVEIRLDGEDYLEMFDDEILGLVSEN